METVGSYEAKTHLPQLLDRVAKGESITITKHGKPIARLVPVKEKPTVDLQQVLAETRAFRRAHPRGEPSIKELINEGRRL
jgi:prevent-host-death family protein